MGAGFRRMAIVVAVCAFAGAIAGIAGSAAAPSKKSATAAKHTKKARAMKRLFRGGFGPGPGFGHFMGGPVHAEAVIPKPDGSGFDTVTTDSGTLNGVDGTTVDVKEGTDKATYKDSVKIDVGSAATVIRDGKKATLGDLKAGDHVRVIQGPKGNAVFAADDAFIAQEQKDHDGWGHDGFGHGGPPPGGSGTPAPGDAPGGYPGGDDQGANPNS